jgi:hypothetical protein
VVSEIQGLIQSTSTKVAASFKSELILLLGDIGHRNPELCSKIIPIIFPHLVDSESFMVRGAAAEAYREIVMRDRSCLPENVTIVLAALLGDEFLYPVRVAVEAFEWIQVKDFQLAGKVVNRLIPIYAAYRQDQSQGRLLEKISAALVNVADTHTPFLPYAAQVSRNLANHQYYYSAKDGLRSLRRLTRRHKEYQPLYLSALLDYYSRGKSDSEFEELYELSPEVIKSETAKLVAVAQGQKESHNLIHFACLLIMIGMYKEAAALFKRYSTLLPEEERYDWSRSRYNALALLLEAEVALTDLDLNKAKKLTEQALEVIGSHEKPKRNLPFGLEQAIPKEAEKPDFYVIWIQVRKIWLNLNDDLAELDKVSEEVIQKIEELRASTTDQVALQAQEELAAAVKFLSQWYRCVLNGDPGQDAKREAIKAHLSEALKSVLENSYENIESRIKDQISKVDSLSATSGIREFLQELILDPMPMPYHDLPMPQHSRRPTKRDTSETLTKEDPETSHASVAFAKVLIDGQEIPQIITMVAGRIHDLRIEIELSEVNPEVRELYLMPVSVLPEDEYIFPKQSVPLLKGKNTYEIKGHLQFKHAQSELSEPIDTKIQIYLHKPDGTNEPCTVFGQSQLIFRVIDEARLLAQGQAEVAAVEKVFKGLGTIISDFTILDYSNEREIVTCIINYAGDQLADPSFTVSETDEKDFQKDLSRYLYIKLGRSHVLREVKSGRGFLDLLALGVPVELKVFKGHEKLEDFIETSLPQATQYTVSQGFRANYCHANRYR